jgi:hypothetical protein
MAPRKTPGLISGAHAFGGAEDRLSDEGWELCWEAGGLWIYGLSVRVICINRRGF